MRLKQEVNFLPCCAAWLALGSLLFLPAGPATANNIRVTNVGLTKQDTVTKTVNVVFDLAWENSWRDSENWDAAWVLVKFRAPGSSVWEHALLATNSASHKLPASATNSAVPDGMGVFIYPAANHIGPVNYAGTKLKWNYGSNGYDFATGVVVEVSVHAIEMVLIPQGSFYLGSGGAEAGHFYEYTDGNQDTKPFLVSSTNAINITNSAGNLYYTSGSGGDQTGIISNSFPNGYTAFYCMKYEITQGQYAEFLNKLTTAQASTRFPNQYGMRRHTIASNAPNYYNATAADRACNYLSWADGCAYADWAALRPMTELEFEKACRGAAYPVANEFAWGNTIAIKITGESGTVGSGMEIAIPTNANCRDPGWESGWPYRVGIFAARENATRTLSGAGYYGVMELSGNVYERCVTVGNDTGRSFTGLHGDGMLTNAAGAADVIDWPSANDVGAGMRGNRSPSTFSLAAPISDRSGANYISVPRHVNSGWRGVRTAP